MQQPFIKNRPGTYVLFLVLKMDANLTIGRLGSFHLSKGYYAYVGSALGPGGLFSRILHHLSFTASPHWHIDYLHAAATPLAVWYSESDRRLEHIWASVLLSSRRASIPVPGFGSSDCKCSSHLFYYRQIPTLRWFKQAVGKREPNHTRIHSATAAIINSGDVANGSN